MAQMVLPEDVARHLRKFLAPKLPYAHEYRTCVRRLNNGPEMDEFYEDIQAKLFTDGENVIEAFVEYVDAAMATQRSKDVMAQYQDHPDAQGFSRSVAMNIERQTAKFHVLMALVYGEEIADILETNMLGLELFDVLQDQYKYVTGIDTGYIQIVG
jgi:hypothetical protein